MKTTDCDLYIVTLNHTFFSTGRVQTDQYFYAVPVGNGFTLFDAQRLKDPVLFLHKLDGVYDVNVNHVQTLLTSQEVAKIK